MGKDDFCIVVWKWACSTHLLGTWFDLGKNVNRKGNLEFNFPFMGETRNMVPDCPVPLEAEYTTNWPPKMADFFFLYGHFYLPSCGIPRTDGDEVCLRTLESILSFYSKDPLILFILFFFQGCVFCISSRIML